MWKWLGGVLIAALVGLGVLYVPPTVSMAQQSYPLQPFQCPAGQFTYAFNPVTGGLPGWFCATPGVAKQIITPPVTTVGDLAVWGNTNGTSLIDNGTAFPSITVANNNGLKALPVPTAGTVAYRAGFATAGDGGGAAYTFASANCSISGGDNGSQVQPTTGTGCWLVTYPVTGLSVMVWGAVCDGSTNDASAITAAISAAASKSSRLLFPSTPCFSSTGAVVPANVSLEMATFFPGNPATGSALICPNTVSVCLTFSGGSSPLGTLQSSNVTVKGSGTPSSGEIGIKFLNGYNNPIINLNAVNFDTCIEFQTPNSGGLSTIITNPNTSQCATHGLVYDGWAELRLLGGRFGENGAGDYSTQQDYIYITNSGCTVAGCGPNTLIIVGTQFNSSEPVACAFRFGGIAAGAKQPSFIKLIGVHEETPVASGNTGIFCSDSSVSVITALTAIGSDFTPNDGLTPAFALNGATQMSEWKFAENHFEGCHNMTLVPTVASGFSADNFTGNFGCGQFSVTASGSGTNTLTTSDNQWGSLAIAGAWSRLQIDDIYTTAAVTDTATGNIYMTAEPWQTWTPVLQFGGSSTGWSPETISGQYRRTPVGGFDVQYSLSIATVGTATGAATLSGMPLSCISGLNDLTNAASSNLAAMSGLSPMATFSADAVVHFEKPGTTGPTPLTDANFTSTSNGINGMAHCSQAR